MLRINQQSDAQAAKSYYGSPAEYYGADEQEMIGEWFGEGADRLGLGGGTILQHQFARLCDNRHPLTGEQLTARTRKGRCPAMAGDGSAASGRSHRDAGGPENGTGDRETGRKSF